MIRRGRPRAHRALMLAATAVSALFLALYLVHHARAGATPFRGTGAARTLYFFVLATHTVLAAAVPPAVLRAIHLARRGRLEEHRRWARWVFPAWLYVSATGVAVYWMLYRL